MKQPLESLPSAPRVLRKGATMCRDAYSPATIHKNAVPHVPPFAPLPRVVGGFSCLVADVPLRFTSNSLAKPGRNAMGHYRCLPAEQLAALPVRDIAAPDAWLFFWATGPCLPQAFNIITAWGFKYSGSGFVWIKLRRAHDSNQLRLAPIAEADLHIGLGHTTRKNAEFCLLARRGRPQRLAADVREVVLAPVREHSRLLARRRDFSFGDQLADAGSPLAVVHTPDTSTPASASAWTFCFACEVTGTVCL